MKFKTSSSSKTMSDAAARTLLRLITPPRVVRRQKKRKRERGEGERERERGQRGRKQARPGETVSSR